MLTKKKTFIFFTIEAGLAHITRSLAVAEQLVSRNHRVIYALTKNKQFLIKNKKIEVLDIGEFFNDEQLVAKIKDPSYIYPFVLEEIEILKRYKPDLVVVDFRLSALISCKILDLPLVVITNSDGLPFEIYLPNLGLPKLVQSLITPLFRVIISKFKSQYLDPLTKVAKLVGKNFKKDDLFDVIAYIVPEPKDYLPLQRNAPNVYYVGPIWWGGFETYKPPWLDNIRPDGRTIYLTFGGTGYDPNKLLDLSEALVKKGYRVIVSSSNIVDAKKFKSLDNLYIEKFLPGFEVSRRVDLILCHGGIGTLVQALLSKRPVVVVPFNPDQYLHAFRFQELGLGKYVINLNLVNLIKLDWEGSEQRARELPISPILEAVETVLKEKEKYKKPLIRYAKLFSETDGAKQAASIVERLV